MNIKRISASGNHCNFCQSGKMVDGVLKYPYTEVTSITSGKNGGVTVFVCDECLTEISNIQN